ncbi:DUF4360 domain-containing protein [Oligoflexus tunisiensis]|uniref:DUF4360 domain-containing protein n=1 Tax=Oligoflexus tunisiensis TaxID=708132 RepID=UPI00114CF1C7|nr:DUF4360 domain-containing protein [Oligoflexus tunisiensis]
MKLAAFFLLGLPFLAYAGSEQAMISNSVPEGFELQNFRFIYDEATCGKINFVLNPRNGDCSVEFETFHTMGTDTASCDLTIEVDLPPGLAMTPSRLTVEGDYQFDDGGSITLDAHYTLEGAADRIVLQRYWSNTDAGLVSNSFLEEELWTAPRPFSPCGGTAVFKGSFSLGASSFPLQKQSLIDIGKANLGAASEKKAPIAYWGWDYQICKAEEAKR